MKNPLSDSKKTVFFHLPGLFEFFDFYKVFLPFFYQHRDFFYDWAEIASIYGAPADCLWGGGRTSLASSDAQEIFDFMQQYRISPRLTFSNSLLKEEHLADKKCNSLCRLFEKSKASCGIIIYSDLLLDYLRKKYPAFYYISTTTKVLIDFDEFYKELQRPEFEYIVPDFRLNKSERMKELSQKEKDKVEFLCNECCSVNCKSRKECYQNVSEKNLGLPVKDHICASPDSSGGYRFSLAMKNPAFISLGDIQNFYIKEGFSNFKIEGRGLGSAMLLEFILYYMTKPDFHLYVREGIYLDSMLDLF